MTKKRKLDFGSGFKGSGDFDGVKLGKDFVTADLSGADYNFDFNSKCSLSC